MQNTLNSIKIVVKIENIVAKIDLKNEFCIR